MANNQAPVILSDSEESQTPGNTPTLGENSAYTLTETSEKTDNSITLYEIKNQTASVTYTDQNGETQSYDYSTKILNEKYYDINYTIDTPTNNRKNFTTAEDRPAIDEHFVGVNKVLESGAAEGGAIYQLRGSINSITGDFIGNYINSSNSYANGGAIMVFRTSIGDITGDFIGNYANAGTYANGGAIYNGSISTIGDITGNFIGNYANVGTYASGGAIFNFNNSTIGDITGDFIGNYANAGTYASGGAIYNGSISTIGDITGNFIGNYLNAGTYANGGAIYLYKASIGDITGDFIGNYINAVTTAQGASIYTNNSTIGDITGNFIGNYAVTLNNEVLGGAIFSTNSTIGDITGSFINNYAKTSSDSYPALGGAIYTNNNLKFNADGSDEKTAVSLFSGNYTEDSRGKIPNAIFALTNIQTPVNEEVTLNDGTVKTLKTGYTYEFITPEITLNAVNKGAIIFNDQIDGGEIKKIVEVDKDAGTSATVAQTLTREHQYDLHLTGDSSSNIVLNNAVRNANITMDSTNVTIRDAQDLNFAKGEGINSLTINSGNLNFLTMGTTPVHLATLNLNGGVINIANSDLDLRAGTMGRLSADSYGEGAKTTINVQNLTVAKDMKNGVNDMALAFADKSFAKNVNYTGSKDLYSKILKYHTWYDSASGNFNVRRIGGVGGYNPAILASSVAAQTGAYVAQTAAFNQAFSHADGFMNNSYRARYALQTNNRYALQDNNLLYSNNETTDKSIWVQPYASFESISLKNGPKVNTTSYGTFVGGNGDLKELSNGWSTVTTAYVGYNGSSQSYNGINVYQNGGLLGATQTWYKGNFYTALTANAGASVGEANTPYGHDNFTMLMAGVASKTGYNLEFKEGRYIIQPSMMVGYSFINTFDYTSAAGVRIKHDPMNSIQLRPNMKFIANLKNGWQPYASVGMVWNLLNENKVTANDVRLPEMGMKPYVEYGVGVQRNWKDKFTAFGQAMLRNGGRNGIALTAGFRWALGHDGKPIEKVQNDKKVIPSSAVRAFANAQNDKMRIPSTFGSGWHEVTGEGSKISTHPDLPSQGKVKTNSTSVGSKNTAARTVLKQLTPKQKIALGAKPQNTTRTTNIGVIK